MPTYTTETFISKAKVTHGDKYSYSKCFYVNARDKVKITCRQHGDFLQSPYAHLQGKGCADCKFEKLADIHRHSRSDFLDAAHTKHGDRYMYDRVVYINSQTKVTIGCRDHGYFEQTPASHLSGRGCQKCQCLGLDKWKREVEKIHGDRYDYGRVMYTSSGDKVEIVCKVHGAFMQVAGEHLYKKAGCPRCQVNGFNIHKKGFLYVLVSDNKMKIGITGNLKKRITTLKHATPFEFSVLRVVKGDGCHIRDLEKHLHSLFENAGLKGFDGSTEWFVYDSKVSECLN